MEGLMEEPLSGYTVVELAIAVQGPAAGLYLRDMGAEVVKVEPPTGDASRHGRNRNNSLPQGTIGAQFVAVNRGKRSVCLDLTTDPGMTAFHALIVNADVFLTNYRQPALEKLGLDYETLHAKCPDLVYGSVNGFGPVGEDADKAMLDGAAVARGGLLSVTGPEDGAAYLPGAVIGDTSGAMHLALGIVTALLARARGAGGQRVQTSALGTQLWLQQWELTHVSMTGEELVRSGNHHPNIRGTYGVYETRCGGEIMLATTMALEAWDAVCLFADIPDLAVDPRLQMPGQRLGEGLNDDDSDFVRARLAVGMKSKTAVEWDAFLRTQPEVIWERVRSYKEVLEDPQSIANGYITEVDIPGVGLKRTIGNLVTLSETPGSTKGPPPGLGEGNEELLTKAGLSADAITHVTQSAVQVRERLFEEARVVREALQRQIEAQHRQ